MTTWRDPQVSTDSYFVTSISFSKLSSMYFDFLFLKLPLELFHCLKCNSSCDLNHCLKDSRGIIDLEFIVYILHLRLFSFIVESFKFPIYSFSISLYTSINLPVNNPSTASVFCIPVGPVLEPLLKRERGKPTTKLGTQCGAYSS